MLLFCLQNQPLISFGRPKGDGEVRLISNVDKRKQDRLFSFTFIVRKNVFKLILPLSIKLQQVTWSIIDFVIYNIFATSSKWIWLVIRHNFSLCTDTSSYLTWPSSFARDEETTTRWRTSSTSTTSRSPTTPRLTRRGKRSVPLQNHRVCMKTDDFWSGAAVSRSLKKKSEPLNIHGWEINYLQCPSTNMEDAGLMT